MRFIHPTLILVFALLSACAQPDGPAGLPDGVSEKVTPNKIVVVGPMTGRYANYGRQTFAGATAAAELINARGGAGGFPLSVVAVDDRCERNEALLVADRLMHEGAQLVIGHPCPTTFLFTAPIYDRRASVVIGTGPALSEMAAAPLTSVFHVAGTRYQLGEIAGDRAGLRFRPSSVTMIHRFGEVSGGVTGGIERGLSAHGVERIDRIATLSGERDLKAAARRAVGMQAELFVIAGPLVDAVVIIPELRRRDAQAPVVVVPTDLHDEGDIATIASLLGPDVLFALSRPPNSTRKRCVHSPVCRMRTWRR